MSTITLWFHPEKNKKVQFQDGNSTSKIKKIWNKTNLDIRLPTSDTNFSFISVWNHKVMVLNGKLFSCSFQKSPNFYFWHNSEWNNSLKSTLVFLGYNLYVSQLKHYPILLLLVIAHSYVGQIICPAPFFKTRELEEFFQTIRKCPSCF